MGVNCGTQYNCDAEYPRAVLRLVALFTAYEQSLRNGGGGGGAKFPRTSRSRSLIILNDSRFKEPLIKTRGCFSKVNPQTFSFSYCFD